MKQYNNKYNNNNYHENEQNQSINCITISKLHEIISKILKMDYSEEIYTISKKKYSNQGNLTNYDYHYLEVINIISELQNIHNEYNKNYCISNVNLHESNIVDILVIFSKYSSGELYCGILGNDLKEHVHELPKIFYKNVLNSPKTSIMKQNFTFSGIRKKRFMIFKKYPYFCQNYFIEIAVNLRLLQMFLFDKQIIDIRDSKNTGILGLDVKVNIPAEINSHIYNVDKSLNPVKYGPGLFLFRKNGISYYNEFNVLRHLVKIDCFKTIYHKPIHLDSHKLNPGEDFLNFIKDKTIFAYIGWDKHAKCLIKDYFRHVIYILDPWININFIFEKNKHFRFIYKLAFDNQWTLIFFPRQISDQPPGEGSCGIATFARLMYLSYTYQYIDYDDSIVNYFNVELPDWAAQSASQFIRK